MSHNLLDGIRKAIAEAGLPVSAQYIARKLKISWITALRYALELLIAGEIRGFKTTRGWLFCGLNCIISND